MCDFLWTMWASLGGFLLSMRPDSFEGRVLAHREDGQWLLHAVTKVLWFNSRNI